MLLMRVSEQVTSGLQEDHKKCWDLHVHAEGQPQDSQESQAGACDTEAPGTQSQHPTVPGVNDDHIVQRVTDGHKAAIGHHLRIKMSRHQIQRKKISG